MHEHPAGFVVNLTDGSVKFTLPDGTIREISVKEGNTGWAPAEKHLPENTGGKALEVILIEMKSTMPEKK